MQKHGTSRNERREREDEHDDQTNRWVGGRREKVSERLDGRPTTTSCGSWVKRFSVSFLQVGQGVRLGHKRNQEVWRTSESTMRSWMTVQDPTRRWDDSMEDDEGRSVK